MREKYLLNFPTNKFQAQWSKILIANQFVKYEPKIKNAEKTYSQICFLRYKHNMDVYNKQIIQEIKQLECTQPTACEAMRFYRLFSVSTLWPPLHSRKEINWTLLQLEKVLEPKERRRLRTLVRR